MIRNTYISLSCAAPNFGQEEHSDYPHPPCSAEQSGRSEQCEECDARRRPAVFSEGRVHAEGSAVFATLCSSDSFHADSPNSRHRFGRRINLCLRLGPRNRRGIGTGGSNHKRHGGRAVELHVQHAADGRLDRRRGGRTELPSATTGMVFAGQPTGINKEAGQNTRESDRPSLPIDARSRLERDIPIDWLDAVEAARLKHGLEHDGEPLRAPAILAN